MQLIVAKSPRAIEYVKLDQLAGKTIAIDASMAMYQYLMGGPETYSLPGEKFDKDHIFKDPQGNLSGHLLGMFSRNVQFMDQGIKPIWVFDGKPPKLKLDELIKRKVKREESEKERKAAIEAGDLEKAAKMASRTIKVSFDMVKDSMKLCDLMGCGYLKAPCEGEA